MFGLPQGKLALCFSDPAGANACLGLCHMHKLEGMPVPLLFSNKQYKGADHNFNIVISEEVPDWKALGIEVLFTGTSHPASSNRFEVRCIAAAKQQGLYVISFIDHWVNFKLRFEGLLPADYPDEIWILDEGAKALALGEGLPAERLKIRNNPYLEFLKKYWHSSFTGKNYLSTLGINTERRHVLFAPDPISLRVGKDFAGFTESEALQDLLEIMSANFSDLHLVIKCHPLQPDNDLLEVSNKFPAISSHLIRQADTPELIHASDIVIGFYSNILLEAVALGKKTIRYFPGNWEADLLRHNTSLAKACTNTKELADEINKLKHG